jgi:photosystem II stability/assembly factor-like uncharacterized protein
MDQYITGENKIARESKKMKKQLFVLILFFLSSINLFSQWRDVSSGLPVISGPGYTMDALDSLNAAISLGNLYVTTNGGESWNNKNSTYAFMDISILNSSNIFGVTGLPIKIFASTDGGSNWSVSFSGDSTISKFLNCIHFFNNNTGIAIGDAPDDSSPALFLLTTNGGGSWRSMNSGYLLGAYSGDLWTRMSFPSISTGYFYDSKTQKVYKTTDTCKTWTQLNAPSGITTIRFCNNDYGFVHGFNNYPSSLSRTTDGGATWQTMPVMGESSDWGKDFRFLSSDPAKMWFLSTNNLYFSADSGKSWTKDPVSYSFSKGRKLVFKNDNGGWLLADKVFRTSTSDRVAAFFNDENNNKPLSFELLSNFPNPFNPSTNITFTIPSHGSVMINIYDILGNKVKTLLDEGLNSGKHSINWNGENDKGVKTASGIYFYQIKWNNAVQTRKMLLIK